MKIRASIAGTLVVGAFGVGMIQSVPPAHADTVAYLVNVTVRPGYDFPNAEAALAYGYDVCEKVRTGESYASVLAGIGQDFGTSDDYQQSYLVTQSVNELCPAQIWQLRQSAAGYTPTR